MGNRVSAAGAVPLPLLENAYTSPRPRQSQGRHGWYLGLGCALQPRKLLLHLIQRLPLEHAHTSGPPTGFIDDPHVDGIVNNALQDSLLRRSWYILLPWFELHKQDDGIVHDAFMDSLLKRKLHLSRKIPCLLVHNALNDIVSDAEVSPHTRHAQSLNLPRFLFREESPQLCPSLRTPFFFRVRIRAERSETLASELAIRPTHHEH